jgi:hypothetical protein
MEIPVQVNRKPTFWDKTSGQCREFLIGKGELYNIKVHTVPFQIQCMQGSLWITREGDPQDYLLQNCRIAEFEAGGHIVIQGLSQGKFRIISN